MFCSTIIPTINRPTLTRAVQSILEQDAPGGDFEIIVVNDSGVPLTNMEWQSLKCVRVIDTYRKERSVARNTGAALARGKYLHFLDDDDWLLPGALRAFWELDQTNQGKWLYGGYEVVDNRGQVLERIQPTIGGNIFALLVSGEAIPLQASLVEADLFHGAGGFDPAFVFTEDRDLGRRLALQADVAGTTTLVARIRIGEVSSTTDWAKVPELDRMGRDKAMRAPGATKRLRDSIHSNYWRGRVSRAFISSAVWNLRQHNYAVAASRASAALGLANIHFLAHDFRRGLKQQ